MFKVIVLCTISHTVFKYYAVYSICLAVRIQSSILNIAIVSDTLYRKPKAAFILL